MLCKEPTGPKGNYALSPTQLPSIKEYIPCLNSDLGGDRNNVLEQIFEGIQLNEGTVGPTPEQLVISTPDEGPKPEEIQSEVQGNEGERQQRPSSILQSPCFGSKLAKYHSSSTGTPSSVGRLGPFDGDPIIPTEFLTRWLG